MPAQVSSRRLHEKEQYSRVSFVTIVLHVLYMQGHGCASVFSDGVVVVVVMVVVVVVVVV